MIFTWGPQLAQELFPLYEASPGLQLAEQTAQHRPWGASGTPAWTRIQHPLCSQFHGLRQVPSPAAGLTMHLLWPGQV